MNRRHFLLVALSTIGAGTLAIQACGQTMPSQEDVGYFDDAGDFHTLDGTIFVPGSACVGFDVTVRRWTPVHVVA
jgi:hypothetical protein